MRPTWVEIDLDAIRHNVTGIVAAVYPATVCAVVKADGYGHGDVPVAHAALDAGAHSLAVALVEEGVRLREAGVEAPILLLSEPPPGDVPDVIEWGLTPTAYTRGFVAALTEARPRSETPVGVHLKVDTGMHRVGADAGLVVELADVIGSASTLRLAGLWTHFAVAEEDPDFTKAQIERFVEAVDDLTRAGHEPVIRHAANTAGALGRSDARFEMVRVGLGMYGMRPAPHIAPGLDLRPAMRVVSRVSLARRHPEGTRPSYGRRRPLRAAATVATVPVGYADGIARRLSDIDGEVLIRGRRYPFAGTVTMDQIVVDVGDDPVEVGDEVVLLGSQDGEAIPAEEWARRLGTINYEIVCRFGPRMPRRYDGARR